MLRWNIVKDGLVLKGEFKMICDKCESMSSFSWESPTEDMKCITCKCGICGYEWDEPNILYLRKLIRELEDNYYSKFLK